MNEQKPHRALIRKESAEIEKQLTEIMPFEQEDVQGSFSRPWRLALIAVFAFFGLGAGLAAIAPLSSAVIAGGMVVADGQRLEVRSLQGGIVAELSVKEGQVVRSGQNLVLLDDGAGLSSLEVKLSQLRRTTARAARLRAQLDGSNSIDFSHWSMSSPENPSEIGEIKQDELRVLQAERASDASQLGVLSSQREQAINLQSGLRARMESLRSQLASVQQELDAMMEIAERGFVSRNQLAVREREIARLRGEIGEAEAEIARLSNSAVESQRSGGALLSGRREGLAAQLSEALAAQSRLEEEVQVARNQLNRMQLTSPVDGEILNLRGVTIGTTVAPGEAVLQIVPATSTLIVIGRIRPIDIESARLSKSARVVFSDARAQSKEFLGAVERISADVLQPTPEVEPYYEVAVRLNNDEVKAELGRVPSIGAPATVYLEGDQSTLLMYLVEPIRKLFQRGLRES